MRLKLVALTALAVASLGACSTSSPVVTVTAPTGGPTPGPSASSLVTPVVTPVVTPTPTPDHFYTLDETWSLSPETQPQGSGCSPGLGTLTDGIWFGRVTAWSPTEISFDMECWWTGIGGETEAAARGDEFVNDYYVTNDVATVRTVSIHPDAFGLKGDVLNISDTSTWVEYSPAEVIADPWGSICESALIVWIAVNDGMVTSFAVQWTP